MILNKDLEIYVRDSEKDDWVKRKFIKFGSSNGTVVICQNIWRPEKEIVWKMFKTIDKKDI